jgi:hypothetical protein
MKTLSMIWLLVACACVQAQVVQHGGVYKDSSLTSFFTRNSGWIASDGGFTVPLSGGRVLWLMGDSYIDHYDTVTHTMPCLFQVRNAALLQPTNDWNPQRTATLLGTDKGSFFKNTPDPQYLIWPGAGYQQGDTVYVYGMNIQMKGTGALDFGSGGNDLMVKIKLPEVKVVDYDTLQHLSGITFGLGMYKAPDGYVYTWGCKQSFITGNIYAARFKANNPAGAWAFWDGKGWNKDTAKAAIIGESASTAVYVAKVKDKYVMVSTEFSIDCDGGKEVYAAVSDHITGPFSPRKRIWTINDTAQGHYPFFYTPAIHPEYINDKNELLITYCINGYGKCVPFCVDGRANPAYYRPQGIRVPLALLRGY